MVESKEQVPVKITLTIPKADLPAPEAANWFQLTRANDSIQLLIGYVDPIHASDYVTAVRSGKKNLTLSPEIASRVAMSIGGFMYLRNQVNELFSKMQEGGVDSASKDRGSDG
jgi:hypothetical protein